jgi:peroxiredoxin (alkyl hydroperoxide reductase subunit C)
MIKIGSIIEDFTLDTYFPETGEVKKVNLSDYRGKWLILFFYPADFTFVCPTELKDMANVYDEIRKLNGEVLAISTDTVFTHKAWLENEKLLENVKYPMAADHNGALSKYLGIYNEDNGISDRATVIIDPDGKVSTIYIVDEPIGRSARETVRLLKALKYVSENPGKACPASWDEGAPTIDVSIKIAGHVYEHLKAKESV